MDADRLLREIAEIMEYANAYLDAPRKTRRIYGAPRVREGYFAKTTGELDDEDAEPSAHAEMKAAHHATLGGLYQRIAGQHRSMADHYSSGAQGAHVVDAGADDAEHDFHEGDEGEGMGVEELHKLRLLAAQGHVEARLLLAGLEKQAVSACLRRPQFTDPSASAFRKVLRRTP